MGIDGEMEPDGADVEYVLRDLSADDQEFITDMQYEAFFVPPGAAPYPRSILAEEAIVPYHAGFGTREGDVGVAAEAPDVELLGAAWVRHVPNGYGFVADEIPELGIAVLANARGRGVGSALLAALVDRVPSLSLSCDVRNPAMHLYRRFGFELVRMDGEHTAVMLRRPHS
jgi:ribosomal protein S18 acetylase RimI-like enzyme